MDTNQTEHPAGAPRSRHATMKGRVALVTGGAMGIGEAVARRLGQDGFIVAIADRDMAAAQKCAGSLREQGIDAQAIALDVSDAASITACAEQVARQWGRCDALVNNAGIAKTYDFDKMPLEHWRAVLDVNLTGPLLLVQALLPLMREHQWGRVVNIASISGVLASAGRTGYGTSKAALIGLTRQMAIEFAPFGITANAVAPGPIETPMAAALHSEQTRSSYVNAIPMRRYGMPEEIAGAVAFLVSDDAAYITGHTLPVDGGYLAAGILEI